jgi:putative FmdB family regulatory protein
MAVYQYKCEKCSDEFDVKRGITEFNKETVCPRCGSKDVRRVYQAPNVDGCGCSSDSCGNSAEGQSKPPRRFG